MKIQRYGWLAPLPLVGFLLGCAATGQQRDVDVLAEWMTGSFSSAAQAAEQPEDYFDIRLHMVPIWAARDDGPWLYVEQASAARLGRPYRQRVYRLVARADGAVESRVYLLPGDPLAYAGAWREPGRFDAISLADLELRAGCALVLRRRDAETFGGATQGKGCRSTLRGATYAMSEATIHPDRLITWDRGFDADDQQVWGATAGGYIFRRTEGDQE